MKIQGNEKILACASTDLKKILLEFKKLNECEDKNTLIEEVTELRDKVNHIIVDRF